MKCVPLLHCLVINDVRQSVDKYLFFVSSVCQQRVTNKTNSGLLWLTKQSLSIIVNGKYGFLLLILISFVLFCFFVFVLFCFVLFCFAWIGFALSCFVLCLFLSYPNITNTRYWVLFHSLVCLCDLWPLLLS